jgi:hypothetical protein
MNSNGPTIEDFEGIGWNTVVPGNPELTERCVLQLLSLIGHVLVQIRDSLPAVQEQR